MPTLNWTGKDAVVKHHKNVPFRLLEPVPELSCCPADAGNLIVQGDNVNSPEIRQWLGEVVGKEGITFKHPPYALEL